MRTGAIPMILATGSNTLRDDLVADERLRTKPEGIFSSRNRGRALCNKTL